MKVLALCTITLFAGLGAGYTIQDKAQDKAQDKQDKKPPAAAADMAGEQPGPEHAMIAKWCGEWTGVVKMMGAESKCTMSRKMMTGGFHALEEFKGEMQGMAFTGHGVSGYDLAKKQYWGFWVDSMGSAPSLSWGGYDDKKKELTLTGEMPGQDGKLTKMSMITRFKDDDHHEFAIKAPMGSEGAVREMFTISYTRKK